MVDLMAAKLECTTVDNLASLLVADSVVLMVVGKEYNLVIDLALKME